MFLAYFRDNNQIIITTPFPNQDTIHHDVAQAQFRSKLDMTKAYEQTCIKSEDLYKTMFSTLFGTFQSHVIQMGDCNAPSTFQWLMTITVQDFIGKFVHVYLDDIFIFLNSLEEHLEHIIMVLQWLREAHFFLSKSKVDLFSNNMDCLGRVIWWQENSCWIRQDAVHSGVENTPKLQWSPEVSWTSTISGTVHARCNGIYHPIIRLCIQ